MEAANCVISHTDLEQPAVLLRDTSIARFMSDGCKFGSLNFAQNLLTTRKMTHYIPASRFYAE